MPESGIPLVCLDNGSDINDYYIPLILYISNRVVANINHQSRPEIGRFQSGVKVVSCHIDCQSYQSQLRKLDQSTIGYGDGCHFVTAD